MTDAALDTEIDLSLLEDFDDVVPCSADGDTCEKKATHFLGCGKCSQRETMCDMHTTQIIIQRMAAPESPIIFNDTCGHICPVGDCSVTPM